MVEDEDSATLLLVPTVAITAMTCISLSGPVLFTAAATAPEY